MQITASLTDADDLLARLKNFEDQFVERKPLATRRETG
jgi:hypothetical protein